MTRRELLKIAVSIPLLPCGEKVHRHMMLKPSEETAVNTLEYATVMIVVRRSSPGFRLCRNLSDYLSADVPDGVYIHRICHEGAATYSMKLVWEGRQRYFTLEGSSSLGDIQHYLNHLQAH